MRNILKIILKGIIKMCEQICWDCKKATGGCSWVDGFKPVEGWDATPTVVDGVEESFEIKSCPEFEQDDIRIISKTELARLLKTNNNVLNYWLIGKLKKKKTIKKYNKQLKTLGVELIRYEDEERNIINYGIKKISPQFENLKTG